MTESDRTLWSHIYCSFLGHRRAGESVSTKKNRDRLIQQPAKVREIYLPIEELAKAERYHKRLKPQREDGPIILLNVGGKTVVIDGNNRINKWERKGKSELTRTIIMEAL